MVTGWGVYRYIQDIAIKNINNIPKSTYPHINPQQLAIPLSRKSRPSLSSMWNLRVASPITSGFPKTWPNFGSSICLFNCKHQKKNSRENVRCTKRALILRDIPGYQLRNTYVGISGGLFSKIWRIPYDRHHRQGTLIWVTPNDPLWHASN